MWIWRKSGKIYVFVWLWCSKIVNSDGEQIIVHPVCVLWTGG